MQAYIKTPQAAAVLGVSYISLTNAMQRGWVERPGRDSSGHLAWTPKDLAAARQALAARKKRKPENTGAGVA
jgi:hypothetical protein